MSPFLTIIIAILVILVLTGGLVFAGLRGSVSGEAVMRERIQVYASIPDLNPRREGSRERGRWVLLRRQLNQLLGSITSEKLTWQLLSANWPMSATEFILIRIGVALAGLLFGWAAFGSLISGAGLAVIAYLVPAFLLNRAVHQRQLNFEKQLVDVLVLINGAVRAGFSLLQAMEVVTREMAAPASEEFLRVTRETGLGLSVSQALGNMATRMQNRDLDLMVTAINIHFQVGGNLATMLQAVSTTIRDRIRLFAEVRVLTTQQRYTSYILTVLPFFVAGLLLFVNPNYMEGLFTRQMICVPIVAIFNIVIGTIIIQRMVKIDV